MATGTARMNASRPDQRCRPLINRGAPTDGIFPYIIRDDTNWMTAPKRAPEASQALTVAGLENTEFLDKTDNFARKRQTDTLLKFEGEVDRPYLNTEASLKLHDPILDRNLLLTKTGSKTTVTWNPGAALAAKLPDLNPDAWRQFVCLETANAAENAITLQPRQAHTMEMNLKIDRKDAW